MKKFSTTVSHGGTQTPPECDVESPHPQDIAGCDFEDSSDGIDWDDIIATTQDDFLAGRFAFNSADYATDEEAMAALEQLIHNIFEEVRSEFAAAGASSL